MSPLPPPPDLQAALNQFDSWGSVVHHILFASPVVANESAHQSAAQSGLEATIQEVKRQFPLWPGAQVDWSKITIDRAQRWMPAHFFGAHFHFELRKPLLSFPGTTYPHPFDDAAGAPLRRRSVIREAELPPHQGEETQGYAYALLNPPYGLHRPFAHTRDKRHIAPLELGTAFLQLCEALFGDLETLEIWNWPTDGSDYFAPGHEWWGSSFWTVYTPSKNWIVTIIASSTD